MTPEERYAFWRGELSRCIRCNAFAATYVLRARAKSACSTTTIPALRTRPSPIRLRKTCSTSSVPSTSFRCTDRGECSCVCPQHILAASLNRKFIKDINELYGDYQAGADFDSRPPLMDFRKDDCEPSVVHERGGAQ